MVSGEQNSDDRDSDDDLRLRRVTQIREWPQPIGNQAREQGQLPGSRPDERDYPHTHGPTSDAVSGTGQAGFPKFGNLALTTFQSGLASHRQSEGQLPCYEQSVWTKYEKRYQIDLNGMVTVAQTRGRSTAMFVVRQTLNRTSYDKLSLLQHLRQEPAFVRVFEVYSSTPLCHFICEYMDITLEHLMGAPVYPDEKHIAAIAGQLVQGLVFLHRDNYFHGNLKLSTILANQNGEVKIAEGDVCQTDPAKSKASCLRDIQSLGEIIMFLVTKSSGEEPRPDDTRYSSDVLDFVSQANISTANELNKHKLISGDWSRDDLVWLFKFTLMTARRRHILPWQEPKGK